MASFKATALARALADRLRLSIALVGVTMVEGSGTSNDPTITLGTGVSRGPNAFIRITDMTNPTAKDSLGNTQTNFTPCLVQLATEANFAGTTDNIADNLTTARLMDILGEVLAVGAYTEWYQEADGTTPTETTITASKLKQSFPQDRRWPLAGQ